MQKADDMEETEKASMRAAGDLQIIGAGLPRTGTMSLCTALEMLGYDKCHHFKNIMAFPYTEARQWQQVLHTEDAATRRKIIKQIYQDHGCRSAVDYPTSAFIADLVEIYPNAKFVHGVRSSPLAWRKSWNSTLNRNYKRTQYWTCFLVPLWQMALYPTMKGFLAWDEKRLGATLFGEDDDIALYERHNEFVKRVVPKDRLLEFEPKMGFEPLCEFLGVAVPKDEHGSEIPYPHVNDTKQLNSGLNFLMYFGLVHWAALLGAVWWVNRTYGVLQW
ncbi:hypothetical protein LTR37_008313 [Vermiconidia calcicola]|uniref:Uncharacterized protein n=1 Tax=Vermiconidia calcicola TaxID=1690605 RepID=A0ACC3NCB0_9PEZI|nr:hypothetical protein LTR37_008313 [Vermiconidia calcicola]